MAGSDATVARRHHPLVALAAASATAFVLSGCVFGGSPADRTDVGATAAPATPLVEPGPGAECAEGVYTQGDDKLDPADEMLSAGFAVDDALSGFDVLCSLTWTERADECDMVFSRAFIDGGEQGARRQEIDEALARWARAHGLEQTRISTVDNTRSYGIEVEPDDGALMTLLQWDTVSRHDGAEEVQRHADQSGLALDGADVLVSWQVCPTLQGWEVPPSP